jgi:hypothetical protein
MNKRIRELAHQADLVIKKSNGNDFRFGAMDPKLEKFAELIVQECANWIVNNAGTIDHLGPEYFAQAMKNEFRVEE